MYFHRVHRFFHKYRHASSCVGMDGKRRCESEICQMETRQLRLNSHMLKKKKKKGFTVTRGGVLARFEKRRTTAFGNTENSHTEVSKGEKKPLTTR